MRRSNDQSIREILTGIFREPALRDKLTETQIRQGWPTWFGTAVARYTDELRFSRGTLEVRLNSATLRQEYRLMAERLRDRVNGELGGEPVRKVLVR
jgi:hypothetical protein